MKFGKYLEQSAVPEWRYAYFEYKDMKKKIAAAEQALIDQGLPPHPRKQAHNRSFSLSWRESGHPPDSQVPLVIEGSPTDGYHTTVPRTYPAWTEEQEFFKAMDDELKKIDDFFQETQKDFMEMLAQFKEQEDLLINHVARIKKPRQLLKHNFIELYRGLELLKNYSVDNFTAFAKILKKHDKVLKVNTSNQYLAKVKTMAFYQTDSLKRLSLSTESLYRKIYRSKHDVKFLKEGRMLDEQQNKNLRGNFFFLGVNVGICLLLTYLVFDIIAANVHGENYIRTRVHQFFVEWPIYRGSILFLLHIVLFGVNMFIWENHRINYRYIFEFDVSTRPYIGSANILVFSTAWMIPVLLCLFAEVLSLYGGTHEEEESYHFLTFNYLELANKSTMSGILLIVICIVSALPFNVLYRNARMAFWGTMGELVATPFKSVTFRAFFLGDQLCSQSRALADMIYMGCFFTSGAWLRRGDDRCRASFNTYSVVCYVLPYWWRFLQCLRRYADSREAIPHLANAGKYFAAMMVSVANVLLPRWGWIVVSIISSAYSYSWDVYADWGLLRDLNPKSDTFLLRDELLYGTKWQYYFAMLSNLLLRVTWIVTLSPKILYNHLSPEFSILALGALEVLRRFQWNLYRVENEQLNNCGKFRALNIIPLPILQSPLLGDDEETVAMLTQHTEVSASIQLKPNESKFQVFANIDEEAPLLKKGN